MLSPHPISSTATSASIAAKAIPSDILAAIRAVTGDLPQIYLAYKANIRTL